MYFSRSPIPHNGLSLAHKHLGIYAYTHSALQKVQQCKPSTLASSERLEQLNFLAAGIPIFLHTVQKGTIGIDTMEDFKKALTLT